MTRPSGARWSSPRLSLGDPGAVGDLKSVLPAVRVALVRAEEPEIPRLHVHLHDIAEEPAHDPRGLGCYCTRSGHLDSVVTEIWQPQVSQQQASISVRVGAHAACTLWGELGQFGSQASVAVEQLR